jgi:hypothetical protein
MVDWFLFATQKEAQSLSWVMVEEDDLHFLTTQKFVCFPIQTKNCCALTYPTYKIKMF